MGNYPTGQCFMATRFLFSTLAVLFIACFNDVNGHGGMVEPPMRSYMWKDGFDTPINYDWNSLYCGGFAKFRENGGKCGLCGDAYTGPFENDKGGAYDTGMIVRHYPETLGEIQVKIELTAHHKGYFQFKLCPNNEHPLSQRCLDRYPLVIREGRSQGTPYRYAPPLNPKLHELHVTLPPDVICDRCVLQWTYTAGNSAGVGPDGRSCLGCGLQETFVNCADISIGGTVDSVHVTNTSHIPEEEIVIPMRQDSVDIIKNAAPDTSVLDVLSAFDITWPNMRPRSRAEQSVRTTRPRPNPRMVTNFSPFPSVTDAPIIRRRRPTMRTSAPQRPTQRPNRRSRTKRPRSRTMGETNKGSNTRRINLLGITRPRNPKVTQKPRILTGSNTAITRASGRDRKMAMLENMRKTVEGMRRKDFQKWKGATIQDLKRARATKSSQSKVKQTGTDIFGNKQNIPSVLDLRKVVPKDVIWRRSNGMTSHRDAVRYLPHLDTLDIPHETLQRQIPDVPLDMLSRQEMDPMAQRRSRILRENWFPETRHMSSSQRMYRHMDNFSNLHERIPRRIYVHSMTVAQHLLSRYPQLKGRVYLSREAHTRDTLSHMANKYRTRQRWF